MNSNIKPKKACAPGTPAKIGSVLLGLLCLYTRISFSCSMSKAKSNYKAIGILGLMLFGESLFALGAKKLWQYSKMQDKQFFEAHRSLKKKYLDAFEINEILSK